MTYGIMITPDDGIPYEFTADSMFVAIGASGVTPQGVIYRYDTRYTPPAGYDLVVYISDPFPSPTDYTKQMRYRINASGHVELYIDAGGSNVWFSGLFYIIYLIPQLAGGAYGSYGFNIYGNNRYIGLSDNNYIYNTSFVGEVDIYTGWRPAKINSRYTAQNSVCFFYIDNQNYSIIHTNSSDLALRVFLRGTDNYTHGHSLKAKIVILERGNPVPGTWGINIYAANGGLAFTSGQKQVGTGRIGRIRDVGATVFEGISRPMFIPQNVATKGDYQYALGNSGNAILPVPYRWNTTTRYLQMSELNSLFIDAADYFHF